MEHLTNRQIQAYVVGASAPADLLATDEHLASCPSCRERAAALAGAGPGSADLAEAVLPADSHLTDEQLAAFVDGTPGGQWPSIERHLGACRTCAREVDELRDWARRPGAARRRLLYAAAAAAVLAVLAPVSLRWLALPDRSGALAGLETLPPAARQRVEEALRAGVAQPPADLAGLRAAREALMGAAAASPFQVGGPRGIVASDRPVFRWEPFPGAERYTVSVVDEAMNVVAQAPAGSEPSWTPPRPLPRGRTLQWQVTAEGGGTVARAPVPPDAPASFRVLDADTAALLERAAREHAGAHLLLGILYTQAGLVSEARGHLAAVRPEDQGFAVARRTLERLRVPD